MRYFVYALLNESVNKIYIGQTNNLERRLIEHNSKKGKHFTTNFLGSWKLIYQEELATRTYAIKREKSLKSYRGRMFIKNLIQSSIAQR